VSEADDYAMRTAREDRARALSDERERRMEERQDARREQDRLFEAHKHMTTLSAAALALVFGATRVGAQDLPLLPGSICFGLSLLMALIGMNDALIYDMAPKKDRRFVGGWVRIGWAISFALFLAGVLFVVILPVLEH
jgi:hypothetical protein